MTIFFFLSLINFMLSVTETEIKLTCDQQFYLILQTITLIPPLCELVSRSFPRITKSWSRDASRTKLKNIAWFWSWSWKM